MKPVNYKKRALLSKNTKLYEVFMQTNGEYMSNKESCLAYLKRYAEKDLEGISEMFDDEIVLRDWNIVVHGKSNALMETRKNFDSVRSILIDPLFLYENQNSIAAELKITLNGNDELHVVDVITFNASGKIQSIRAYKGRGDG